MHWLHPYNEEVSMSKSSVHFNKKKKKNRHLKKRDRQTNWIFTSCNDIQHISFPVIVFWLSLKKASVAVKMDYKLFSLYIGKKYHIHMVQSNVTNGGPDIKILTKNTEWITSPPVKLQMRAYAMQWSYWAYPECVDKVNLTVKAKIQVHFCTRHKKLLPFVKSYGPIIWLNNTFIQD